MFVKDYVKNGIALESLSVHTLESIDIQNIEEQKLIQALVDKKRLSLPTDKQIRYQSDKTDFKTKEEELAFQKIIDERKAKLLPQSQVEVQSEKTEVKKFCDFCDAVGPIKHKVGCTRKEKTLTDKIAQLKAQQASL